MTLNIYTDDSSPMSTSDVESFTGKIVCNIDGSSYIIDAENATLSSLNDNSLSVAAISVTNEKTSILQTTKSASEKVCVNSSILNATRATAEEAATAKVFSSPTDDQQQAAANPKIHTFRVVSANDASIQLRQENKIFKIQKPILMCFICKLSFGITKSFSLHANTEHGLDLQDLEKHLLLQREYSSAIIQKNMDENPQISFLEPVDIEAPTLSATPTVASSVEEYSDKEAAAPLQLDNDELKGAEEQRVRTTAYNLQHATVSLSTVENVSSSNTSSSSSSSTSSSSSSSPLSPCCTVKSTVTTTSSTTTIASSDKPEVVTSYRIPEDLQSQCTHDNSTPIKDHGAALSTASSASSTNTTTTTTTLGSLNLNKPNTNSNYNSSNPSTDHVTTSAAVIATANKNNTTIAAFSSSPTLSLPSTTEISTTAATLTILSSPSSLSLKTGVDLSASTGNLATDAISTDSLKNINKCNNNINSNNDNSNNDSIKPHSQQHINNVTSSNLSPKSHHHKNVQHHQSTSSSINTSIMGDFLQQHLQRIVTVGGGGVCQTGEEDLQQQKHLEHENMSWSQPTANTFSSPATSSNASTTQISSLQASLAALNSEQNTTSVKLISEFLQHQLVAAQHQQHQQQHSQIQPTHPLSHTDTPTNSMLNTINVCPEHTDFKGIDCKTCEMLEIQLTYKQSPQITPQRSPTNSAAAVGLGLLTAANQLSMSPNNSLNPNNMPPGVNASINTPPLSTPGSAASFTIGACSDHINGRPLGVECARCEMILNSARLNSNVQMSTRNSCKTLKCPQCNWHYKYQETLEIHMREKHPDGESACGYCLAGQQHPRLARGESYSCGYKPYRCEICNYSTTTKGNLSIHMQSDKHLNNMQELNSSQNMVAAAVAVATGNVGKLDTSPKINIGNALSSLSQQQHQHQQQQQQQHQQQQQQQSQHGLNNTTSGAVLSTGTGGSSSSLQSSNALQPGNGGAVGGGSSNKPKPSFRCDICSYETSVARNLRIHMTSEKHTHNMAVLQNNIKHIQAFSFLQQQQQTQQQSGNFMPEVALADLAYNQALMIQLLHQNAAASAAAAQSQNQLPATVAAAPPPAGPSAMGTQPPLATMAANNGAIKLQDTPSTTTVEMLSSSSFSPKPNDFSSNELATNIEPPIKPDLWPTMLYSCLVCANFNTNSLDELNQHLLIDRSRQIAPTSGSATSALSPTTPASISSSVSMSFSDIMMVQNNNYICRLCNYKTNLKANFQLHSKTDKHLQKLNFINHLREGGIRNEYKLKYYQQQQQQIGANTVQIKCNSCDFYTNSIQKLSLHTQHMRHETMIMIFQHLNYLVQQQKQQQQTSSTGGSCSNDGSSINLVSSETAPQSLVDGTPTTTTTTTSAATTAAAPTPPTTASADDCNNTVFFSKSLLCHLCNFNANSLLEMIQHVKSIRHLQVEQFVCLQRRSEQLETPSLDDVFKLCDKSLRINDPTTSTTATATLTHASNMFDNKAAATACFTSLIESGAEDFQSKMIFEHSEDNINANIENITNYTSSSLNSSLRPHHTQHNSSEATTATEAGAGTIASNIPAIIYRCNHCDYFGPTRNEVVSHIDSMHPYADSEDVISIPTNPVAIQAFQAAMAAATLAAVSRASKTSYIQSPSASPNSVQTKLTVTTIQDDDDDMGPVAIKRECLDLGDQQRMHDEEVTITTDENAAMDTVEQRDEVVHTKHHPQMGSGVQCPLCQDYFTEKHTLEIHLMSVHSVNKDGLARLLLLVDTSVWQQNEDIFSRTQKGPNEAASASTKPITDVPSGPKTAITAAATTYELLQCQQCGSGFRHEQHLLQHAQKMQHYTLHQGEYLCLASKTARNRCTMHFPTLTAMFNHYNETHMSLVISERHVYKYRCKQCSLAFKTQEKLATHTLYHTMRDATKCTMCQRNFRSTQALQKHMEQAHSQATATVANSSECSSPRTVSPSGSETEKPPVPQSGRTTSTSDKLENELNRSVTPSQDLCRNQSPGSTVNEPQTSLSPSAHQQQQQMAAISALIKQQQQQQASAPSEIFHHLQMQQHQQYQNLPTLHNLQQMPQLAAAAAASGMPLNPVEMLNLMQFHHLMSLNFMNLAPPLIFGGNASAAAVPSVGGSSNPPTSSNMPSNNVSQPQPPISTTSDSSAPSSATSTLVTNIASATVSALPNVDVNAQMLQQQQQQQISPGASSSQLTNNQKRARTRITDDQLKILRAHFDINNSPSEESILEMSQKANLPMKVVKHWFRNTLFKERQRNKDSPYNFNNPPSTTLNLEEYERTGQTKVMPLSDQMQQQQPQTPSRPSSAHSISNISEYSSQQQQQQLEHKQREEAEILRSQASSVASSTFPLDVQIKTEPGEDLTTNTIETSAAAAMSTFLKQQQQKLRFSNLDQQDSDLAVMTEQNLTSAAIAAAAAQQQQQHAAAVAAAATFYNSYETKSESGSSDMHSRPQTPNSNTTSNLYASMNDLLSQQLENMPLNQMGPPKKFQLNPSSNPCSSIAGSTTSERSTNLSQAVPGVSSSTTGGITVSSKLFEKHSPSAQYDTNSNSSNSSTTSSGKRANRTRFTDYQIKVLQEFFENNSYPKDSDLEYLSKLLLLSPRVIVVWFQNARQKQRKIYENQPNNSLYESEEKKQNINYACKKCSLVFQRYYELIRHQKNHCFKEENNKKSAKAQIAAAQIAQNLSSEDSNSSMDINSAAAAALLAQHHPVVAAAAGLVKNAPSASEFSPVPSSATTPPRDHGGNSTSSSNEQQKFDCDKCKMTFTHFENLREHQLMHLVNPNLHLPGENHATAAAAAAAAYGPFGSILQSLQQAAHLQHAAANSQPAAKKRKYSETSSNADEVSSSGGFSLTGADYDSHAKKYNFLYQYFLQNEGNSELRQQFHNQDSADLNMEFLANYYQQTELKKRNNYDFLFQYYLRNEQQTNANFELDDNNKPNIEFLLQYYQLCESKKFFQLEASPQRIHDGTLTPGGVITTQHNMNTSSSSNNSSSRHASNDSNSSHGGSGINEESNGGGVLNNIESDGADTEVKTRQNGQHSKSNNNNNNNELLETEKNNHSFSPKTAEDITNHNISKLGEQMDQLDGLQEVNNHSNSNHAITIATTSTPSHLPSDLSTGAGTYYQNLEDFLDATMIENHSQTLTFPLESNIIDVVKPSRTPSPPMTTTTTCLIQPLAAVSTAVHAENSNQKQTSKRLRTTILPEQLNFLYECYQNESNPSRKMLEEIAKKVNLKKRVVQVWFQNSRAKDKKSRNQQRQHFSNISDDNSNSSGMTNNTNRANASALKTTLKTAATGSETSNDIIKDCNLCHMPQVNMQQHAFTVDHIRKVKELLAQTTATAVTLLNNSGDEEKECPQNEHRELIRNCGVFPQNAQQQQLALMMIALQSSQNIPLDNTGSFNSITFNKENDGNVTECDSADLHEKTNLDSKSAVKVNKSAKRNPSKKKKYMAKYVTASTPVIASSSLMYDEVFLNSNANLVGDDSTLMTSTWNRQVKKHVKIANNRVNILSLSQDENDGNNHHHHPQGEGDETVDDGAGICIADNESGKHENSKNRESINNANDMTKLYSYNQITVMEGK